MKNVEIKKGMAYLEPVLKNTSHVKYKVQKTLFKLRSCSPKISLKYEKKKPSGSAFEILQKH